MRSRILPIGISREMIRAERKRLIEERRRARQEEKEQEKKAIQEARYNSEVNKNRRAALQAYLNGEGTIKEIAERFKVSLWALNDLIQKGGHRKKKYSKREKTGAKHSHISLTLDSEIEQFIRATGTPISEYINIVLRKHIARNKNKNKHESKTNLQSEAND